MSNLIFPTLIGEGLPVIRTPNHNTLIQTSASGIEVRIALQSAALYQWELPFEWLSSDAAIADWQTLMGFFNQLHGGFDSFRYTDPYDNTAVTTLFGTGDGTTTKFQLGRVLGGALEPVYEVKSGTLHVFLNGSETSAFTIDAQGLITFTTAPGSGVLITATFQFYWRARFGSGGTNASTGDGDSFSFENFAFNFWELKKLLFYQTRA